MSTVTVADFAPWVELKVQHAPTANVHHAIREAVAYFMRHSRAAVDEVYINVPCREREVVVEPRSCQRLVQIERVFVDPHCRRDGRWAPDWDELPHSDREQGGWWIDDVGGPNATLWLADTSPREQRLCVRYSWAIKRDNCDVPEWIYEDHADSIANGAIAYLHANASDSEATVPFAAVVGPEFKLAIDEARTRKEAQYRARRMKLSTRGYFGG